MRAIYLSPVTKFYAVLWSGPGFIPGYKAVMGAGAKAKTVTNLFTLLSVLEVSCAIRDLSGEQRREACRRVGIAGWLISGQAGKYYKSYLLQFKLENNLWLQYYLSKLN